MLGHVRLSTFRERLIRACPNRIDKWQNVEGQRHVAHRSGAAIGAGRLSGHCGMKTRLFAATQAALKRARHRSVAEGAQFDSAGAAASILGRTADEPQIRFQAKRTWTARQH
jgi:hypothetical protein